MEKEISLTAYRIFNAVAKTGNITAASKELYISQPAVSKAITKLEQELSVSLFSRSSRGVKLTESGRILYEYTNMAFSKLSEGEAALKKIHSLDMGHIRIGASSSLCKYILLPYLKEFISIYPHITFSIQCQSSIHTLDQLSEGKLDIGLVGKPLKLKALNYTPVLEIEDIFVAAPSYLTNLKLRMASECHTDFQTSRLFFAANLMLLDEENITRQYVESYFDLMEIKPGQVLEVSSMDLLIEFAKTGLGIACVIKNFVENELENGLLTRLHLKKEMKKREVGFVCLKKPASSDAVVKFFEFLQQGLH